MTVTDYASRLIEFDSTCHLSNADVSDYVEQTLTRLGFEVERLEYDDRRGRRKVNVLGRRGSGPGGLAYFGHTDVVPANHWSRNESGAFEPTLEATTGGERLYGRGSTDMKGSLAAILAAVDQRRDQPWTHPLYVSFTADEEINHGGADWIVQHSRLYRELVDGRARAIVGEPTMMDVVYAHKGGCRFTVTSRGRAAHSSTPDGRNANLAMIPFLVEMKAIHDLTTHDPQWLDDEFDPPTVCWNIGINDHTQATNITPPQSVCTVGFRPMPRTDTDRLLELGRLAARDLDLEFQLDARHDPFRTDPDGQFVQLAREVSGAGPPRTVGYGTEASNFKEIDELIVMGPGDIAQAHTNDEWVAVEQLEKATDVYGRLLDQLCGTARGPG